MCIGSFKFFFMCLNQMLTADGILYHVKSCIKVFYIFLHIFTDNDMAAKQNINYHIHRNIFYLWFQSSGHAITSVVQDSVLWTALAWLQGHTCEACDIPVVPPMSSCSHCTMNLWNIWWSPPLKFAVINFIAWIKD